MLDNDGVILGSPVFWQNLKPRIHEEVFGNQIMKRIFENEHIDPYGTDSHTLFHMAKKYGLQDSENEYYTKYDSIVEDIYRQSPFTHGLYETIETIIGCGFSIGIVTSARQQWFDIVLSRLDAKLLSSIHYKLSVHNHFSLKPKPAPDGYVHILKKTHTDPKNAIIIEDSHDGVRAALASEAYTVCTKEHYCSGYNPPEGAHLYIEKLQDLIPIFTFHKDDFLHKDISIFDLLAVNKY